MAKNLDAEEVKELKDDDDVVLIDVLSNESFEDRHIPGAINLPVDEPDFEALIKEKVPDKQAKLIVYCSDEECKASPRAAKTLEELDYENVMHFSGGLAGWRRAGYELTGEPERIEAEQ